MAIGRGRGDGKTWDERRKRNGGLKSSSGKLRPTSVVKYPANPSPESIGTEGYDYTKNPSSNPQVGGVAISGTNTNETYDFSKGSGGASTVASSPTKRRKNNLKANIGSVDGGTGRNIV